MRQLKCHTTHSLASLGVYNVVADFPRGADDPPKENLVALVREHTAAHRLIVQRSIKEEVRVCLSCAARARSSARVRDTFL